MEKVYNILITGKDIGMDVNYKNPKRYKTAKYPIRQPWYLTWLIWILSKMMLAGKKKKIEKIGMEGLKPPYLLLSNHMSFIDFELVALATHPKKVNNVVNIVNKRMDNITNSQSIYLKIRFQPSFCQPRKPSADILPNEHRATDALLLLRIL